MKKIVWMLGLMTAVIAVQAQVTPPERPGKPKERMDNMQRPPGPGMREHMRMMDPALKLSPEQKEQMKQQHENFRKQMDELKKNDNITVKEWRTRMENLRNDQRSKMESILTPDQKAQIEKRKKEQMAIREIDRNAQMEKMKIHLGLSEEQAAKLKKQHEETAFKMKAIHENKTLDMEQKKAQMMDLKKQQQEQLKSVLTEDQMKKMKEMKERQGPRGPRQGFGQRGPREPRGPRGPKSPHEVI